jgi:hypothetical protein
MSKAKSYADRLEPASPSMGMAQQQRAPDEDVGLQDAVSFALEEARMIIPGIQALFGFQLIAAFSDRFNAVFDEPGQVLHMIALILVALSCALALTPAAYHRPCSTVSWRLLLITERFVAAAMVPLALAISIDVGLVAFAVTHSYVWSYGVGVASGVVFTSLWIAYPRLARRG